MLRYLPNRLLKLLLLTCLLSSPQLLDAGERYALVIGNSQYQQLTPLDNPRRDASAMAHALHKEGFQLIDVDGRVMPEPGPLLDLDVMRFTYAVQAFADQIRDAEIAFIYYAGHGMQIDGRSQLLPVDAPLPNLELDKRLLMLSRFAQSLDEILGLLDGKAELTIAVFDACREIPNLERELRAATRSATTAGPHRGLGRISSSGRSRIVAYSGGFGQLVSDGQDDDHSPYTAMLLRHLNDSDRSVEQVFLQVAHDLGKQVGRQDPEVLIQGVEPGRFFLAHRVAQPLRQEVRPGRHADAEAISPSGTSFSDQGLEFELTFWQSADHCGSIECYREYLTKYPSGSFSSLARARLRDLTKPKPQASSAPSAPTREQPVVRLLPPPAERLYASTTRLNPGGDNYLSMRSGPGGTYREIERIYNNGTRVEVVERRGDWLKLRYAGKTGWSFSKYLTTPNGSD